MKCKNVGREIGMLRREMGITAGEAAARIGWMESQWRTAETGITVSLVRQAVALKSLGSRRDAAEELAAADLAAAGPERVGGAPRPTLSQVMRAFDEASVVWGCGEVNGEEGGARADVVG